MQYNQEVESYEKHTVYLVEATDQEKHFLWERWALQNVQYPTALPKEKVDWKEISIGKVRTVGEVNNKPICIGLTWVYINSQLVCFYETTSRMVDWDMIDNYVRNRWPSVPRTNSTNFHNCIDNINRMNNN
jgi:hypothetical protein